MSFGSNEDIEFSIVEDNNEFDSDNEPLVKVGVNGGKVRKTTRKSCKVVLEKEEEPKIKCECGSVVKRVSLYNHEKSKKHCDYLKSKGIALYEFQEHGAKIHRCPCGSKITQKYFNQHCDTYKHINWLSAQNRATDFNLKAQCECTSDYTKCKKEAHLTSLKHKQFKRGDFKTFKCKCGRWVEDNPIMIRLHEDYKIHQKYLESQ